MNNKEKLLQLEKLIEGIFEDIESNRDYYNRVANNKYTERDFIKISTTRNKNIRRQVILDLYDFYKKHIEDIGVIEEEEELNV